MISGCTKGSCKETDVQECCFVQRLKPDQNIDPAPARAVWVCFGLDSDVTVSELSRNLDMFAYVIKNTTWSFRTHVSVKERTFLPHG
jgi:hypothetical protein